MGLDEKIEKQTPFVYPYLKKFLIKSFNEGSVWLLAVTSSSPSGTEKPLWQQVI
jgi:hypothetical protein